MKFDPRYLFSELATGRLGDADLYVINLTKLLKTIYACMIHYVFFSCAHFISMREPLQRSRLL